METKLNAPNSTGWWWGQIVFDNGHRQKWSIAEVVDIDGALHFHSSDGDLWPVTTSAGKNWHSEWVGPIAPPEDT